MEAEMQSERAIQFIELVEEIDADGKPQIEFNINSEAALLLQSMTDKKVAVLTISGP